MSFRLLTPANNTAGLVRTSSGWKPEVSRVKGVGFYDVASGAPTYTSTAFISATGNDGTAALNNPALPFATLAGALASGAETLRLLTSIVEDLTIPPGRTKTDLFFLGHDAVYAITGTLTFSAAAGADGASYSSDPGGLGDYGQSASGTTFDKVAIGTVLAIGGNGGNGGGSNDQNGGDGGSGGNGGSFRLRNGATVASLSCGGGAGGNGGSSSMSTGGNGGAGGNGGTIEVLDTSVLTSHDFAGGSGGTEGGGGGGNGNPGSAGSDGSLI